jgi:hypothetical protein
MGATMTTLQEIKGALGQINGNLGDCQICIYRHEKPRPGETPAADLERAIFLLGEVAEQSTTTLKYLKKYQRQTLKK